MIDRTMIDKIVGQQKTAALAALQTRIPRDVCATEPKGLMRMLQDYPWDVSPIAEYGQDDFLRMNEQFDPRACFGRFVLSCLLIDQWAPWVDYQGAEVVADFCADIIWEKLKHETDPVVRREMAVELLMYEDPHAVVVFKGMQFDVISTLFPRHMEHRCVNILDPWRLVAASRVVNEAFLCGDATAKNIHLQRANAICPGSKLVLQNLACSALELGKNDEARTLIESLHAHFGVSAKGLFTFAEVVDGYEEKLHEVYPPEVIQLLEEEFEQQKKERGIYE